MEDSRKLKPATAEWRALLEGKQVWVSYCDGCGKSCRVARCSCRDILCQSCFADHPCQLPFPGVS